MLFPRRITMGDFLITILSFVVAVLALALVAAFIAVYRYVEVDLSLPAGIHLKLRGRK
jgi:hypothetical protein